MALYTYVPGKAELVELMWDRAQGRLPAAYDVSEGWRSALEAWSVANWDFAQQHPWTLHISGARPTLGPNETRNVEAAAAVEVGGSWRPGMTALVLAIWAIAGMLLVPRVLRRMARRQSGSQVEAARDAAVQWVR